MLAQAPIKKRTRPNWLKIKLSTSGKFLETQKLIRENNLHTVCEEARCPNIYECWGRQTATIMILGDTCTRSCGFCSVKTGKPVATDTIEPIRTGHTVNAMNLRHVVITSVDRDDIKNDYGADIWAETIEQIRIQAPDCTIEVLTPDFRRNGDSYKKVVVANPDVFNHNIETVPNLYLKVRPGSRYFASVNLLKSVKEINSTIFTKSGVMLGLGETKDQIVQVMDDLLSANVDFLTIGQYLQPSVKHHPLQRYVHPDEFEELKKIALSKGFLIVSSSPLTRSSYHADEDFLKMKKLREKQSQCHSLQ